MASPNPTCPSYKRWRGVNARNELRAKELTKEPTFVSRSSLSIYVPPELQSVIKIRPREFSPDDLPAAFAAVKGSEKSFWLPAVTAIRLALSKSADAPIQAVVDSGVLPRLAAFMSGADAPGLQLQAAWALTNVASGSSSQCGAVVAAGAVAPAMALLEAEDSGLREQVAWLLGNIAGDGAECRDKLLAAGLAGRLLPLIPREEAAIVLRQLVWLLSNLLRFKPRPLPFLLQALPVVARLVARTDDSEALTDALFCLFYIAETDECARAVVQQAGKALARASRIIQSGRPPKAVSPACKTMGSLASCEELETQAVVDSGVLGGGFRRILSDRAADKKQLQEVCFAASNVAAGTQAQVEAVLAAGLLPLLLALLGGGGGGGGGGGQQQQPKEVQREALYAVANIAVKGGTFATRVSEADGGAALAAGLEGVAAGRWADKRLGDNLAEALLQMVKAGAAAAAADGGDNAVLAAMARSGADGAVRRALEAGLDCKYSPGLRAHFLPPSE